MSSPVTSALAAGGVQAPQIQYPDPSAPYQKAIALSDMMAQRNLRNAQLQQEQAKTQELNRQLEFRNVLTKAYQYDHDQQSQQQQAPGTPTAASVDASAAPQDSSAAAVPAAPTSPRPYVPDHNNITDYLTRNGYGYEANQLNKEQAAIVDTNLKNDAARIKNQGDRAKLLGSYYASLPDPNQIATTTDPVQQKALQDQWVGGFVRAAKASLASGMLSPQEAQQVQQELIQVGNGGYNQQIAALTAQGALAGIDADKQSQMAVANINATSERALRGMQADEATVKTTAAARQIAGQDFDPDVDGASPEAWAAFTAKNPKANLPATMPADPAAYFHNIAVPPATQEKIDAINARADAAVQRAKSVGGLDKLGADTIVKLSDPNASADDKAQARQILSNIAALKSAESGAGGRFDRTQYTKNLADYEKTVANKDQQWAAVAQIDAALKGTDGRGTTLVDDPLNGKHVNVAILKAKRDGLAQRATDAQKHAEDVLQNSLGGTVGSPAAAPGPEGENDDEDMVEVTPKSPAAPPKTIQPPTKSSPQPSPGAPPTKPPVPTVAPGQQKAGISNAPPASALKEGFNTTFKNGKGTWTLRNGQVVQVSK